jgi:hypothetical protein
MRADIHDGAEQMLQSETVYIDARPHQPGSTKTSCNARPDHTLGSKREAALFGLMSASTSYGRAAARGYEWTGLEATASFGASTILGNRIVKVEPRPGALSTVMSPPIIWQKRLLIASPRPVPTVESWKNSWNTPAITSRDSTHTWCPGANPILKIGSL